jgi:isocitrate dehydrogenase
MLTAPNDGAFTAKVVQLLDALGRGGVDWVKTEHLYTFDGVPGYSLGQGQ